MFDVLTDPVIRVVFSNGEEDRVSLPAVFAGLIKDGIIAFPALRPHQRHAWHAFLVQLGTMAMQKAGITEPPDDEASWRDLLLWLTSPDQGKTSWSLIASFDQPALLQAAIPDEESLKNKIHTPDAIDILVTSKNHDIKQAVMRMPGVDDWLFALITLQTMNGSLGVGNYGISRMNSGYGNRPAVSLVPPGGIGVHLRRDMNALLGIRDEIATRHGYPLSGGLGLVWLAPWDGNSALAPGDLDPLYIEICRRIRLIIEDGMIVGLAGNSKTTRIAQSPGGVTGDPWTPLRMDKDGVVEVLTPGGAGFNYRQMVDLVFSRQGPPSPLQLPAAGDPEQGMSMLARALVRGQGKTDGYHERSVPLSKKALFRGPSDPAAAIAMERISLAGEMRLRVLKPAILALVQNGPDKINFKSDDPRVIFFLDEFDRMVDRRFFEDLWIEAEEDDVDKRAHIRSIWVRSLFEHVGLIFERADLAMPKVSHRRWKTTTRARSVLNAFLKTNKMLKQFFETNGVLSMSEKKQDSGALALSMAGIIASDNFSSGYRATLRRLDPTDMGSWAEPAVQRLLVRILPDESVSMQATRDWGLLAHLLAIAAPDLQSGGPDFGKALYDAGYSESRLMRLLDADRDNLDILLPRAIRFLVSKAQRLSPPELIHFIRSASGHDEKPSERSKLKIAGAYYRTERDTSSTINGNQTEAP